MDEFRERQLSLLRQFASDYVAGHIDLNTFIQKLEGISNAIASPAWKDAVFPIVLAIEQVNASALTSNKPLTAEDRAIVEKGLRDLRGLANRFASEKS